MSGKSIRTDVVIIGGGHNALVAAAYLASAGRSVIICEARDVLGGAVASTSPFPGVEARLSTYSYLVSLLPETIIRDLGLDLELRSRRIATYTPVGDSGVIVDRENPARTRRSFEALTGSDAEYTAWTSFHDQLGQVARTIAPTLTEPLPRARDLAAAVGAASWDSLTRRPIGELITATFADDTIRGIVATDALIGTDSWADDPSLRQNRCFLYHVIGNGTGEWRVPVGGMGRVAAELERAARRAGADLRTNCAVAGLEPGHDGVAVRLANGSTMIADHALANCAPATLATLLGDPAPTTPDGTQIKINLVVRRLPRFRSGMDPRDGFAGTLHLHQGYTRLSEAYHESSIDVPNPLPCEVYCHSLTDDTVVGEAERAAGFHTLTLFGLHTPARLFDDDHDGCRTTVQRLALQSLQDVLAEPLDDCLARDRDGRPCVQVMLPHDVEAELGMPRGNIFHGDLAWPWLDDGETAETPAERWGVATDHDRVLLCGSGARRGGAVSGIGGHNAAMALLED